MLAPPEPKDDSRPFSSQVSQTAPSSAGRIEQPKHDYRKPAPTIPLKGAYRNREPLHPTCHHTNRNKDNAPLAGRQYLFFFSPGLSSQGPTQTLVPMVNETNGQRDHYLARAKVPTTGRALLDHKELPYTPPLETYPSPKPLSLPGRTATMQGDRTLSRDAPNTRKTPERAEASRKYGAVSACAPRPSPSRRYHQRTIPDAPGQVD